MEVFLAVLGRAGYTLPSGVDSVYTLYYSGVHGDQSPRPRP